MSGRKLLVYLVVAGLTLTLACTELEEELTPENTPEETKSYGSISITSDPSGAAIWLDGDSTEAVTDTTLNDILIGKHGIRLTQLGWADVYDTVIVQYSRTTTLDKSLSEVYGSLQVNSTPSGADIYIDGVASGKKTNHLMERLQVGTHTVDLVLDGYGTIECHDTVEIEEGKLKTISATMPCGNIEVNSTPTGADVYIDDVATGKKTNSLIERVQTGNCTVKLMKACYADWSQALTVTINKTSSMNAYLEYLGGELVWRYGTGNRVISSPAIGPDGTIYFGSWDDYIYALSSSGIRKWKYQTGSLVTSSPAIGPDGTVYCGSWDGYIYALSPTGTLKWRFQTGYDNTPSPAISSDGTVYFGLDDGYFYALYPSCSLKWKYETGDGFHSGPAIGSDGTIYFGCDDFYFYALKSDGTLKWRIRIGYYTFSYPAIGSDGTVYFGANDWNDYYLYALTPEGNLKWRYKTVGDLPSSPAIGSDGTVYLGANDNLYALNSSGSLKWKYETGDHVSSSPAIGSDGTIYVGSYDDYLYAVNPDGTLKWRYQTGYDVCSSPAVGNDSTVYVGSKDGFIYAIKSTSKGIADSPWPKYKHDNQNTGRAGAPLAQ